ncbi:hypothetical protein DFJ63DRAFT_288897 [Scheffersomyces coipomensis]|uniref:uncharacterized protein n=1 Tax=Scheffersomyces coipomensis TaxID=1788519 RepID=UPI00315CBF4A
MITANLTIESPPTSVIRPNGHSHTDTITFHAVGNAGDSNIRHERKGTQSSVSSSNEETSAEYEGGTKNGQHTHAIVLIGLRGVGKSTLALMASAALKFKYVGVENCVRDYTGMPEALYLNKVSLDEYKDLQYRLITQSLTENEHKNSIYVLPSSSIDNVKVVEFLQKNAKKYCIINIECEELRILNYMEYSNDMEKGIQMIQAKVLKYRSIANFNFFNLHSDLTMIQRNLISIGNTDNNSEEDEDEDTNQHHHHLLLKPLEREFVQFLTFIIKGSNSASTISGDLHLKLSIDKKFSSCLQIRYPQVLNLNFWDNIDEIIYGVDALEVKIDIILLTRQINNAYAIVKLEEFIAQLKRITNCSLPIVLSIHNSISDINQFTHGSSEAIKSEVFNYYYNFLYSISKLAMDYITLDLGLFVPDTNHDSTIVMDHLNKIKGNTKIIGSFTSQDPDFWKIKINGLAIVELSRKLKLNYLRLNSFATRLSDNFKIFKFNQFVSENYPNLTISTFNNNELGKFSKICNKFLTPVDIPISSNPSLVSSQIHQALYSSFLLPSLKFYIMGRDVSNSLSPVIHNTAYKALGLPHTYATFECSTLMPYLAELVKSPNFGGTAIIMPFKLEALKYVDSMSNHVKIIGALNSIVAERSFENPNQITCIRGENTDWLGVRLSLIDNISPINAVSKNKTALVLGAGGMSRSAIYALIQLGYQRILLYNRTFNKAQDLANYYNSLSPIRPSSSLSTGEYDSNIDDLKYFEIILLNDDEFNGGIIPNNFNYPTIIISCVPSSDRITGQPTNIQFSPNWFKSPSGGVVLETGYEPLITPILQRAKQYKDKGWVSVNGLNYLYAQALAQFEMFTNKPAPRALMKSVVIEHYKTNYA